MIVKRNFNPVKVWTYIQKPMWFVILWSTLVWLAQYFTDTLELHISLIHCG